MANLDGPFGFRARRPNSGGTHGRLSEYTIASAYATGLYNGDAIKSASGGGRVIEQAAVGDPVLGFFKGCSFDDEAGRPKFSRYWPANQVATNIVAHVAKSNGQTFLVQATTVASANIGSYCDLAIGTGSATTGNSGAEIDGATFATSRTSETFRVVALSNSPDNAYGANANVEVIVVDPELEA